jgi:hypothetical protein
VENFRVRPVSLHYFLADGTVEVQEPKIKNSGLSHGALVSRQRVVFESCDEDGEPGKSVGSPTNLTSTIAGGLAAPAESSFLKATDLRCGKNLKAFGRVYRINAADHFTKM